jgi:cephalosporin-C deacetylase-like acetyl esterase
MRPWHQYLPDIVAYRLKEWRDEYRVRSRHGQAVTQLKRAAVDLSGRGLDAIETFSDWQQRRPVILGQFQWMLGLEPLPVRTALHAEVTGVMERSAYRVEKLVFQSLPGLYVTGNFYMPKNAKDTVPCVLYLCGHMPHPLGAKASYQDRYLWYPAHGFACLVLDPLEFGEVPGIHRGTHDLNLWHWLSLGYTPAGVEVWNAMRAIDWLTTRAEVDVTRVGVTGISGGGVMSWYLAALDERVSVAAPSCSTYTIGTQIARGLVSGQCDCTYYPNVFALDFPAIAALLAPRPLLITSGQRDRLFPPDGYHEVFRQVKKIYELYDAVKNGPVRIREVDEYVGHTDSPLFLSEARQWMQRWLVPETSRILAEGADGTPLPEAPETLACLRFPPTDAINFSIHDRFIRAATPVAPLTAKAWDERRDALLEGLRDRVFRWFPRESIPFETRAIRNRGAYVPAFARFEENLFQSEPGVLVRALVFKPNRPVVDRKLLIVVKGAGEHVYFPDIDELLPLFRSMSIVVLSPRFTERSQTAASHAVDERVAALLGRSLAALQVWDVLRTVAWALSQEELSVDRVSVYGRGDAGIVALYAALFDDRIKQVILSDPPSSHWQGPALPMILRLTDIPEISGVLAPRRLSILRNIPEAFALTRQIYRLCGADASMDCAPSLIDALRHAVGSGETGCSPSREDTNVSRS